MGSVQDKGVKDERVKFGGHQVEITRTRGQRWR